MTPSRTPISLTSNGGKLLTLPSLLSLSKMRITWFSFGVAKTPLLCGNYGPNSMSMDSFRLLNSRQHAAIAADRGLVLIKEAWHTVQLPDTAKDHVTHGEVETGQKEVVDGLRAISKNALLAYRRLRWAIDNLRLRPQQTAHQVSPRIHCTLRRLFAEHEDFAWRPAYDYFLQGHTSLLTFLTVLRVAAAELEKQAHAKATQLSRSITSAIKTAFTNPQHALRRTFAAARAAPQPPLIALRVDGKLVCQPQELDAEFDKTWTPIFDAQGTTGAMRNAKVMAFCEKYKDQLHHAEQFSVPPLSGAVLMHQARHSHAFAGGLDNLHPRELRILPALSWHWAAEMLTLIEKGEPWPLPALDARATFLLKPDGDSGVLTDYRILLLTSTLYRIWAKARMHHLDPWARSWAVDGMLSAGPGLGAADGHYEVSLRIEQAITAAWQFGGGCTDLAQCFDRIMR